MVLSELPEASLEPSGFHATLVTQPACPAKTWRFFLEEASQMRTVLSPLPEASLVPSAFHATLVTHVV